MYTVYRKQEHESEERLVVVDSKSFRNADDAVETLFHWTLKYSNDIISMSYDPRS